MKDIRTDALDLKALESLMQQGRMTWSELANILGLSGPAVAERVRHLEAQGIIRKYVAIVDPEIVGFSVTAFVSVTLDHPRNRAAFIDEVNALPEVQECYHVAGEDDYLLKVRCIDTHHLDWLISDRLKGIEGIIRARTTIVLSTLKETTTVPLASEYRKVNR